jgi:uncharacterized membrane protein YphA (DoxX/SURF4 family)
VTIGQILLALLAVVFIRAGWLNLFAPDFIRAEFKSWGYSDRLRIAVGATEWAAAIVLLIPSVRLIGCALAIVIILGVIVTFLRHREFMRLEYPAVLLSIILLVAAQTLGWLS